MPGWMKHKLESSLLWEISITSDMQMLLLLLLSCFSHVRLCATPDSSPPGYSILGFSMQPTGVGCHFLLQCMTVKSESEVTQWCPTLSDPMDCSLSDSSVHGIFQARVLEWVSIAFSLCRWHHPYSRKWRRTKEPLDESERGEWKSWLKTQHSEN